MTICVEGRKSADRRRGQRSHQALRQKQCLRERQLHQIPGLRRSVQHIPTDGSRRRQEFQDVRHQEISDQYLQRVAELIPRPTETGIAVHFLHSVRPPTTDHSGAPDLGYARQYSGTRYAKVQIPGPSDAVHCGRTQIHDNLRAHDRRKGSSASLP